MKLPEAVQIPYSTYQNLLEHLPVHAPTDGWAASLLQQLQAEAQVISTQPSIAANVQQATRLSTYRPRRESD
jgi:hypothetical protein